MTSKSSGAGDTGPPAQWPRRDGQAVALVLGATLSVQFGGALAVILIMQVGAVGAVTLRMLLAAVLVVGLVRPRLSGRTRRDVAVGVGLGLVLAAMNVCFYEAAARLPLGAAVTLEFLGPLGLAVVMSRRLRDFLWVGLAGIGVVLLSEGGLEELNAVGAAFGLGAGVCWAAYILLGAEAGRRFRGTDGLAFALVVASIAILPLAAVTTGPTLLAPPTLLLGACVALLCTAVPYTLELTALRRLSPRTFGVLMSLEPAVATVAGFLILDQRLTPWQLAAVGMVVVASAGAMRTARLGAQGTAGDQRRPARTSMLSGATGSTRTHD
ncbi:EamA family transporter [Actinopolymorpha sp. B17G11]|uniref:EamA family transporter n=1 Tax=unclassified Actinopolymorpha TaxID=2627063 RepID=UPI0032D98F6D